LADEYLLGRITSEIVDPISRILGVSIQSMEELNSENIKAMNKLFQETEDSYGNIFSMGSDTDLRRVSKMFQNSYTQIKDVFDEGGIDLDNDGVFTTKEMRYRNHLGTYDGDHLDMLGATDRKSYRHAYSIAVDSAKYCELVEGL
jgi:hypothetical protein